MCPLARVTRLRAPWLRRAKPAYADRADSKPPSRASAYQRGGSGGRGSAPMSRPLVELRGIAKSYGGVQALDDVSFAIAPATVHALVGENGAGKSTLVKILTGVVHPDDGDLLVDG